MTLDASLGDQGFEGVPYHLRCRVAVRVLLQKFVPQFLGQAVGVICIPLWLGFVVYAMSRAAVPNATDSGNWFHTGG